MPGAANNQRRRLLIDTRPSRRERSLRSRPACHRWRSSLFRLFGALFPYGRRGTKKKMRNSIARHATAGSVNFNAPSRWPKRRDARDAINRHRPARFKTPFTFRGLLSRPGSGHKRRIALQLIEISHCTIKHINSNERRFCCCRSVRAFDQCELMNKKKGKIKVKILF